MESTIRSENGILKKSFEYSTAQLPTVLWTYLFPSNRRERFFIRIHDICRVFNFVIYARLLIEQWIYIKVMVIRNHYFMKINLAFYIQEHLISRKYFGMKFSSISVLQMQCQFHQHIGSKRKYAELNQFSKYRFPLNEEIIQTECHSFVPEAYKRRIKSRFQSSTSRQSRLISRRL